MKPRKEKAPPKLWGWKDGVFGRPLPKMKFKSGFVPKSDMPIPKDKKPGGYWWAGKYFEPPTTPVKETKSD